MIYSSSAYEKNILGVIPTNNESETHMLYIVAMVRQPTKDESEQGKEETLVMPPTPIMAKDERAATAKAMLGNKDVTDLTNVNVIVKPF